MKKIKKITTEFPSSITVHRLQFGYARNEMNFRKYYTNWITNTIFRTL